MAQKTSGYMLMALGVFIVVAVWYLGSTLAQTSLMFSPYQALNSLWSRYTVNYLEPETARTLDKQRENITTSEGQSYTMLRAVWVGDKDTFDKTWQWTKDNLQHKSGDHLFAWAFGQRADGSYGVLTAQGGNNAASDGDQDIALALMFAYARWQQDSYLYDGRAIIGDIWAHEVVVANGTSYLAANNLESSASTEAAVINPSYMSPAAYRVFALADPAHPWQKLVDSSYDLIGKSLDASLGNTSSAGLPPDWLRIDKQTGALLAPPVSSGTTNFSFDAMRVPWRLALDYEWYGDPRAADLLKRMSFLSSQWRAQGALASSYARDGSIVDPSETPAMYGATLGYFMLADPAAAKAIYQDKLANLYSSDKNAWKQTLGYYDDNWAWFGMALYNHLLPNLAATLPPQAFQ